MAAGRQRLTLVLVACVLAVTTGWVVVGRFVLRAEWWQVDHKVTLVPAVPLADLGPSPGPLTPTWDEATRVHRGRLSSYDKVSYALVRGQMVAASGRGLDVRDARTGGARWSYRRSGWVLLAWTITRDRLVGYLERAGDRDDRLMIGLDAVSGRLLWRRAGESPAAIARATLRWPAGAGIVLTSGQEGRTVYGRSALTGRRIWTARLPEGCVLSETAAYASGSDENLAVLTLDCDAPPERRGPAIEAEHRVLALDPGTGRTRWTRATGSADPPEVTVREGVTLVSGDSALRAYARDGRELMSREGEDLCGDDMCPAAVAGDRLVVVAEQGRRMLAAQISTGRELWRRDVSGYLALTTAGGSLYALRPRLAGNLLPAGVDVVDPATGEATTTPTTLAVDPGLDGVRPWLAAGGGLLYVAVPEASPRPTGGARMVALRGGPSGPGPVELGGVEVGDWPDACALLDEPDLSAARLTGYVPRAERVRVGPVRLPRPVSCTYEPDKRRGGDPTEPDARGLTVSVKWVAPSRSDAAGLLAALCATQSQVRPRSDVGGDEAYELGPTAGTIAVRVDRYIVAVNASRQSGTASRLARAIAAHLRTL